VDVPTISPRPRPEPVGADDPATQAAADVRAMLAGASGLRRIVELAAETRAEAAAVEPPAQRPAAPRG
jgi:hypothetical protein